MVRHTDGHQMTTATTPTQGGAAQAVSPSSFFLFCIWLSRVLWHHVLPVRTRRAETSKRKSMSPNSHLPSRLFVHVPRGNRYNPCPRSTPRPQPLCCRNGSCLPPACTNSGVRTVARRRWGKIGREWEGERSERYRGPTYRPSPHAGNRGPGWACTMFVIYLYADAARNFLPQRTGRAARRAREP